MADSIEFPFMERRHGYLATFQRTLPSHYGHKEPTNVIDKARFLNKKDEAFGFLCLSISNDLLFHLSGLKTPKEIWDQLASLY